jgi:hypothetical protein
MAEVERKFINRDCKVSAAAKVLNVPRRDLPALLDAKPALLSASFEAVERGLNAAEAVLRQALRKGNARQRIEAAGFILRMSEAGRRRGWGRRGTSPDEPVEPQTVTLKWMD